MPSPSDILSKFQISWSIENIRIHGLVQWRIEALYYMPATPTVPRRVREYAHDHSQIPETVEAIYAHIERMCLDAARARARRERKLQDASKNQ